MPNESDATATTRITPQTIGRYEIVQPIGHGGMGTLFLARDPKIGNRQVVIKVLREGFDSPETRERFQREANAAGALHHTNIVTIFDVGDVEGAPFIAMEFVDGETLTEVVRRRAHFPLGRKIALMEELCAGLYFAHRAGVVHRDIKPANLMIDRDGVLKILDFGIARFGASKVTRTGIVVGTLNYMAPEQLGGQKLDPRADMFSAGAVFYEMLTGVQAFPAQVPAIFQQIMTASFEPLRTVAPEIPADIAAVVTRCLACSRDDRYPDMAVVRKELDVIRQRVVLEEQQALRQHLDDARDALKQGLVDDAMRWAQAALLLDSECVPAQQLQTEAAALSKKQQVDGHLAAARTARARGALTDAELSVEQALAVDATSRDAAAERNAIALERRRLAEERERANNIADALNRAKQALTEEDFEGALRAAQEALMIDEGHAGALAMKAQIESAIAAQREEERKARERAERQQRARAAVDDARRRFAKGDRDAAIQSLATFAPLTLVSTELDELRAQAAAFEKGEQEKREQREAETRRRAQEETIARTVETMRVDPTALEEQAKGDKTVHVDRAVAEAKIREAYDKYRDKGVESPTIVDQPAPAPPPRRARDTAPRPPQPPAPAPQPVAPSRAPWIVVGVAAAIIVVVAIVAALKFLPRATEDTTAGGSGVTGSAAVPAAGTLVIDAVPWAHIDRVVNARGEAQRLPDSSTPLALPLAPGDYTIALSGPPPANERRTITVTVTSNSTKVAPVVPFAEMSVDEYFRSQAGRGR